MPFHFIESWKTCPQGLTDLTRRWSYQYGNGGVIDPAGRGMLLNGSQVSFCNTHFTVASRCMGGFWFTPLKLAATISNSSFMHLLLGGEWNTSNQIGFGIDPNGMLEVFQGDNFSGLGGTTLYTGTVPLLSGKNWIEFDFTSDATAGIFHVKVNGNDECTLTGINSAVRGVGLSGLSFSAGAGTIHLYGGAYFGDGTEGFLGPCEVERLYPVGWTTEANPDYQCQGGLFDAQSYADPGGTTEALQPPSYPPLLVHAIQSTRWVTGTSGNAFFSVTQPEAPIPSGGLTGASGGLYFDALLSAGHVPPIAGLARRHYGGMPG